MVSPGLGVLLESPVLAAPTRGAVLIALLHLEARPEHFELDSALPATGTLRPILAAAAHIWRGAAVQHANGVALYGMAAAALRTHFAGSVAGGTARGWGRRSRYQHGSAPRRMSRHESVLSCA